MAVATHLAAKSALARLDHNAVARRLGPLIEAGLVATCGVVEMEVRCSARSHDEYEQVRHDRRLGYEWLPMPDELWDRALEVQRALSGQGRLRAVRLPDVLIAAVAERHRVIVIHYDHDFGLIARVTDQPTEWVVPKGSLRDKV